MDLEHWLADDRGVLRKPRFMLVLAGIYVVFCATYIPINLFSVGRPAWTLYLPGEERLPFLPVFEYLYILTFLVPVLVVATVHDYERFRRLMRALAVSFVVSYTTYLVFPVYLLRPDLEVSSVHTWLLSLQYLDKSYNHFPSMHVTLSWLAVLAAQGSRASRIRLGVVATGISVSTVFVKQHYIADVVAGAALAWCAWWLGGSYRFASSATDAGASRRTTSPTGFATTSAAE